MNSAKSFGRQGYFASGLRTNRGRRFEKENTSEANKERGKKHSGYKGGRQVICQGQQTSHTSLNLTRPVPCVGGTRGYLQAVSSCMALHCCFC